MRIDVSIPVLVVDDSTAIATIVCTILKQLGFKRVDVAHDGSSALALLQGTKYGLVLSDWNMEPINGYELLKAIRADETLAGVKFIMISADSSIPNVVAAKRADADSYLLKPFSAQSLKAKIEEAVAKR
jgi:two-component system chemotaxis response regulator CheY